MARRSLALLASLAVAVVLALQVQHVAEAAESWLDDSKFTTDGDVRVDRQVASLVLDRHSGAGFYSKEKYLFGEFSIQMKLVPGNSAGVVTCLYLTSGEGDDHDEIDMEFMGNSSGQPVVLNTNVWASGDGKKEHQFYLWFDPSADYHTYTIIWNPKIIIFKVDGATVRAFKRYDDLPYPDARPMAVHATLWDGSFWATEKGKVKIDWSRSPFVVSYRGYSADACVVGGDGRSKCPAGKGWWMDRELTDVEQVDVAWAKRNCLQYNYCEDGWRFPKGFPGECGRN